MMFRGELHCYHCGYIAASMELPEGPATKNVRIVPATNGPGIRRSPGESPRCGRCNGPLFLAEVEPMPPVVQPLVLEAVRPGRPRKSAGWA
ncbi:MAG TPA: hypothetical protein VFZ25_16990 [Chloroflexota bacterium]|nr:hypothetical protein [Chloroflexota bacterium]